MNCQNCKAWCCKSEDIFELNAKPLDYKDCPNLVDGRCVIYEQRPIECRLFPWDVAEVDGKPYLIRWYVCDHDEMKEEQALEILKANPEWIQRCLYHRKLQGFLNKYKKMKFAVIKEL